MRTASKPQMNPPSRDASASRLRRASADGHRWPACGGNGGAAVYEWRLTGRAEDESERARNQRHEGRECGLMPGICTTGS
jgi:hypothetical protein